MKRRDFVKTGSLIGAGSLMIPSILGKLNPEIRQKALDQTFEGFQNPPGSSRLFVRWWWNGNRLSAKEIIRELDVMKKAGIGGVEINPIAFPRNNDPVGYHSMTIFSEEWLDMLEIALKAAKERGIICDMIVGSGWPFGGEFLKKDEQIQMATIETMDLKGDTEFQFTVKELLDKVAPDLHSKNDQVYKDLLSIRLLPKTAARFTPGKEILDQIKDDSLSFKTDKGDFVLYYVVKLTGYMAVINGSPGAAGPVLNHYSKPATENYLNRISGYLNGKIGNMGDYLRAMFCDSMELEGSNWNDDLPEEFLQRRGYDLRPYLPFVLRKTGHMGNPLAEDYGTKFPPEVADTIGRVGLDFYKTRIELFKERFIDTFNSWCHANGVESRMQAYGRGMHPLEASMEIDIPECETWAFKEVGREYPNLGLEGRAPRMSNKYVASAAALAGKKVVSCEEVTNTAMAFMLTLENIKVIGDQSNLSGVNHSILHGFNYSPPEAPFPGWVRYGTYFNERNPWWPYFRNWSDYKARLSYILQNATPQANVAILQPLTDLWLKYGPQRDPFPQKWYPEYQNNIWEAVHQNGGNCDYVSEHILQKSSIRNGQIHFNLRSYNTLLLPEIETIDLDTLKALEDFAAAGGKLIFIEKTPFKSPDYFQSAQHDAAVKKRVAQLLKRRNVHVFPAPGDHIIDWYGQMQEKLAIQSQVIFEKAHKFLSQTAHLLNEKPVFFLSNYSLTETIETKGRFAVSENLYPVVWNPENGEKMLYPTAGKRNELNLVLPPATSLLLVFESQGVNDTYPVAQNIASKTTLSDSWLLELKPIEKAGQKLELDALKSLDQMEQTREFAGVAVYSKTFVNTDAADFIDLGEVQGVSEVWLNDKWLGTKWYGYHRFPVKGSLKKGENKLVVQVTTIPGNYLKSLKDNKVAQDWTHNQEYYPMGLIGPVALL